MISNVRGTFGSVSGTVAYDPENPASTTIHAEIDVATINTQDEKRDAHLKSPDFLDVTQYPKMTFESRKVEAAGSDELTVTGDLTIHGATHEVVLKVEGPTAEGTDPWGKTRIGASATAKIKRSDFGVSWNAALEAGGVVVGDEVKIQLDLQMIKG